MAKKTTGKRVEPRFSGNQKTPHAKKNAASKTHSTRKKTTNTKRRGKGRSALVSFIRKSIYWCFVIGLWISIGVGGIVVYYGAKMPSAQSWSIPNRPPNVKIVSKSGAILANRGITGGQALSLSEMSPYIPLAVMAIEDRRFYNHFGLDPIGLARAMTTNLIKGRMVQGGSTLTQQLAKNLFLSPERTLERKVQEVLLSLWLEHKFSKDQIIEMYLNRVYFGSGSYGVEAASRRYFQKGARNVSLSEAALLAGLLKAPSRLSPVRNPKLAKKRAKVVLNAMKASGVVSQSEIKTAMTRTAEKARSFRKGSENYIADRVMDHITRLVGKIDEDIIVDTTIDLNLQKLAEYEIEKTLKKSAKKLRVEQGALVSVDSMGAIRALIGGRDYSKSQFDRAFEAKRQPGSAFKPFVFAAAFEQGRTPFSERIDAPIKIGRWTPKNYDQKYRGKITLSEAMAKSINTVAAQLAVEVGPKTVTQIAYRLGITSRLKANASIALGTSEVSLVELTGAYATFMNGGYKATPHLISRIRTVSGKTLYANTYNNPPRVLSTKVVSMMNAVLARVIKEGTGKNARLAGWSAAGKTGTTQGFRDALFVGYTAQLTTGVWFGNDDSSPTKKVTGGSIPARTWKNFMTNAHNGMKAQSLPGNNIMPIAPLEVAIPATRPKALIGKTLHPVKPSTNISNDTTASTTNPRPQADVGGSSKNHPSKKTTLLEILLGN